VTSQVMGQTNVSAALLCACEDKMQELPLVGRNHPSLNVALQ